MISLLSTWLLGVVGRRVFAFCLKKGAKKFCSVMINVSKAKFALIACGTLSTRAVTGEAHWGCKVVYENLRADLRANFCFVRYPFEYLN